MKQVEFVPFWITEKAEIFTIKFKDKRESEIHEFIDTFRNTGDNFLQDDFSRIFKTLKVMAAEGILECNFRPEGRLYDRVCALPLLIKSRGKQHGTLRLYCIRISERMLIIGAGGIKHAQTYQEDALLLEKVETLQKIDLELYRIENEGRDLNEEIYNLTIYIN